MAAQGMSKAEYLRRYLSGPAAPEAAQPRRRRKKKPPGGAGRGGMRIVDDDISWNSIAAIQEKEEEEDEGDMPVVAEFIDERPDEVKLMEEFRTNTKWKLLGVLPSPSRGQRHDSPESSPPQNQWVNSLDKLPPRRQRHDSPDPSPPRRERNNSPNSLLPKRQRHDSPDLSPPRRQCHDTPELSPPVQKRHHSPYLSPPRRKRHDTPDLSPPRRKRHDTPDLSPPRRKRHDTPDLSPPRRKRHDTPDLSPPRRKRHDTPDLSPPRRKRHDTPDLSPPRRKRHDTPDLSPPRRKRHDTMELSPPRQRRHDSPDLSPPRRKRHDCTDSPSPRRGARNASDADCRPGRVCSDSPLKQRHTKSSDSDLSPLRRTLPARKDRRRSRSPPDLSPPRHRDAKGSPKKANVMFSGVKAGLVSADVMQREQQELRRHERNNKHLEEESRHAETVFRDKSGRKRDLAQEQLEERRKAEAQSKRDEQYAKWGKGLVQWRQQQQNVKEAIKEMQKPLARYIDDQDLDQMLREQEREGDPMADFIKKRKAKENTEKEKPRYNGPEPPPNRFNIWPGHRWDGLDRSNGFEQQHFARIANKKAVQELAYKWSVEDM
ncbi:BUD13 protein, partial [Geococcyx californianus]|nr:BUD13 protein [Geococcyx californianus]